MRRSIAIAMVCAALALLYPIFGSTNAMFSETFAQQTNQFAGATFSPAVAPVVSVSANANSISLSWTPVSITSAVTVTYEVTRIALGIPPVVVCTGADAPITNGNSTSCADTTVNPGVTYTYTERPYVNVGSTPTWSLSASVPSASVCLKKCK